MVYKLLVFLGLLTSGFFAGATYNNLNKTNLNNKDNHSHIDISDHLLTEKNEEHILNLESEITILQRAQQASQQRQLELEEKILQFTIPRGPLGVRLDMSKVEP